MGRKHKLGVAMKLLPVFQLKKMAQGDRTTCLRLQSMGANWEP